MKQSPRGVECFMNSTRVLHVLYSLKSGGQEMLALSIIKRHDRNQFDPLIVVLDSDSDQIADEFHAMNVPIILCKYDHRYPLKFVLNMAALVRQHHIDVVLCYSFSLLHLWLHL